jgi:molecular chaperone DnaJ
MSDDPYKVLGVGRDATDAEIKRVYRKLARQYHPDRNPGDKAAEERFKSIQSSYDKIGTDEARRKYDESRRMDDFFRSSPRSSNSRFSGFDIPDIFSQMFGGQQNNRQARDRQEQRETYRGSDITSGIDMDFSDAELGCKLEFDHRRLRTCAKCDGTSFGSTRSCVGCDGRGVTSRISTIIVKIPPNSKHGQKIRMRGLGHDHPLGKSGDLILTIRVDAKEGRRWEDGRIIQSVEIPYSTLMLGGKCSLRTPSGDSIRIDVKPGTQIGDRRRIPKMSFGDEDLDVEFVLEDNTKLTDAQIVALERLRDTGL